MTLFDEQITQDRINDLYQQVIGNHFWKDHRPVIGLMSGLLAAVAFPVGQSLNQGPLLHLVESYAMNRLLFDASDPKPLIHLAAETWTRFNAAKMHWPLAPYAPDIIGEEISRAIQYQSIGNVRQCLAAAYHTDRTTVTAISRAWCYRDDLPDDDRTFAFEALLDIGHRRAAYGLFAPDGGQVLL
jgi:hypothetical protein